MRSPRKPFRLKGQLLSISSLSSYKGLALFALLGTLAVVQTPVAGINVPYDNNRNSPDPTDPDFSYSYVLNKDVKYRKPKYFSNVSAPNNFSNISVISKSATSNSTSTSARGTGSSNTAIIAASSPVAVSSSYSSSTPKLTLTPGLLDER